MELKFLGAAGIVTGSCHLLTVSKSQYLLDCGMYQGRKKITKKNYEPFAFDPKKIKAVILSHAHIDHSGLLPKLYRHGFRGNIHCTKATKDLCRIMLEDSADIHEREAEYDNKRLAKEGKPLRSPLYTKKDARRCMGLFRAAEYRKITEISPEVRVIFRDAGHILGSSIVEVFAKDGKNARKIVFSGDLGRFNSPIIRDPSLVREADLVLLESTYGGRMHESIEKRRQMLLAAVRRNYEQRGRLMIPSFAVERAQEIIFRLNEFAEKNLMPRMDVYIDSPLAKKTTEVFISHNECYDEETKNLIARGDNPFRFPGLKFTESVSESKKLNSKKDPCIIIAGSGMCTGGRIKHHLINHLGEKNSTVLFVGYQAEGTLGRKIKEGAKKVKIYGKIYDVKAQVESIEGFSAHADKAGLAKWAANFKDKPRIFLVHGEPKQSEELAREISRFNRNVRVAKMHQSVKLA